MIKIATVLVGDKWYTQSNNWREFNDRTICRKVGKGLRVKASDELAPTPVLPLIRPG